MALVLPVGLGVVAGVFLLIVGGEMFYLFYWRKRPLAYPRGNSVPVAPVNEADAVVGVRDHEEAAVAVAGTGAAAGTDVVLDVTCAEYQIAALHQDLVEKLFPTMELSSTTTDAAAVQSAQTLMAPTRMLFTITEETKEDLERLDIVDGGSKAKAVAICTLKRSGSGKSSKSISDISLSPAGPLSPLSSSTPDFASPLSSPDHFSSPYGTPTCSPFATLPPLCADALPVKATIPSRRVMYDGQQPGVGSSPPLAPPSPTRPSFPFLARAPSPGKSQSQSPSIKSPDVQSSRSSCSSVCDVSSGGGCPMQDTPSSDQGRSSSSRCSTNDNAAAASAAAAAVALFYSSPRKSFALAVPVRKNVAIGIEHRHQRDDDEVLRCKASSGRISSAAAVPFRSCTSVYENGTFSPSSPPSSPQILPHSSSSLLFPTSSSDDDDDDNDPFREEAGRRYEGDVDNDDTSNSPSSSSPPSSSSSSPPSSTSSNSSTPGSRSPFSSHFSNQSPSSHLTTSALPPMITTSSTTNSSYFSCASSCTSSYKPASQRSSSMLFSSTSCPSTTASTPAPCPHTPLANACHSVLQVS